MDDALKQKIEQVVRSDKVVLFVKGTKSFPQCGFSSSVIEIFKSLGVPFQCVNILADQDLRQGLKEYSSWPTFPQIYVDGEFIGGCDIVREMHQHGELAKVVAKAVQPQVLS